MSLFFKDPAPTEIYTYCHTRSLHDALPIIDAEGKLTLKRGKYHDRTKGFAAEGRLAVVEEVSRRDFAAAEERNGLAWKRATERHLAEQRAQAAEEASGDGGMFGSRVGDAVGAYAGAASEDGGSCGKVCVSSGRVWWATDMNTKNK